MTLAESLELPPGWKATRFMSTIELEFQPLLGKLIRTGIPVPYHPMSKDEWIKAAHEAISAIRLDKSTHS